MLVKFKLDDGWLIRKNYNDDDEADDNDFDSFACKGLFRYFYSNTYIRTQIVGIHFRDETRVCTYTVIFSYIIMQLNYFSSLFK